MAARDEPARILVVEDDERTGRVISAMVRHLGHDVVLTDSVESGLRAFAESPFDVVLTDLRLGRRDGFDILRHIRDQAPEVPVVLITGYATVDSAMEAIQSGAYDYLAKPPTLSSMGSILNRAIEKHRSSRSGAAPRPREPAQAGLENIVGTSPAMIEIYKTVARVAPGRSSVLILGESGTGKELVARALHEHSGRRDRRFVPVNVSAIPEGLLETELFGHVRGAFTGASVARRGLFEESHLGTLFLDEIGDLSPALQAKLLRVIQEHRVKPVGGNEEVEVDVRLVAATHRDLEEMVRAGRFREDLYYRLNVVSIALPPLRERRDDIPVLVSHFLAKYGAEAVVAGPKPLRFTPEAQQTLLDYRWPGNVRELENVVERAVLLATHTPITKDVLPPRLFEAPSTATATQEEFPSLDVVIDGYVRRVVDHTGGNLTRAAQILGISRRTLHRMAAKKRVKRPVGQ